MKKVKVSVRDALEDRILTGQLLPGTRVDEVTLAEEFGVSRTPVRQAIFQLAATGLLEQRPRRGAYVAEVGPQLLSEMFQVMAELEALCAANAARRATESDIEMLLACHADCTKAAESGDSDRYYYENETFHELIRTISGNCFLRDEIDTLQKRLKAYRRLQLRARNRMERSLSEHASIVEAIRGGDAAAANAAMRDHITIQGDRFSDLLATLSRNSIAANG
ncbi:MULTISPECIES: GntR family transcriptional regulator [unclassified Sulfitobacter]|uniref:GntR family transcriptional regulator n=1 Tax=unclassified Sulfitobacter TaxID=196795 RepID=UPI0007C2FD40|nr:MULTISPECIES: GntR family transcriptional regulator [unclassified Sulfitobacter]KZY03687.1 AsnC family transcriptional regulator [Sulfitobacter sp. HI0023]KZY24175.1 AsnC family transcriptional regulator [Sulfitobacter sp. HI0040]KZZ71610.1 AsnC family transcriptional regulator [Sulfitobacter sp. HI0129]MBO28817.1 GntR family transcriptional regulator [Paracoccaceae bacterium]